MSDHAPASKEKSGEAPAEGAPRGFFRRRKLLLVIGAVLVAAVTAGIWFSMIKAAAPEEERITPEMALDALDGSSLQLAIERSNAMRERPDATPAELQAAAYVLGITEMIESDEKWAPDPRRPYLLAARLLEEAHGVGFPAGREADGLYQLGRALFLSGQHSNGRVVLKEALPLNPKRQADILRMLAEACLSGAKPNYQDSAAHNAKLLELTDLTPDERNAAILQRAQIQFGQNDLAACLASLDKIPADAKLRAEALVLNARVLMRRADAAKQQSAQKPETEVQAKENYRAAIDLLRQVQHHDSPEPRTTAQAMYLTGVCLVSLEDLPAADLQFGRTQQLHPETPEGLAADLAAADVLRRLGRDRSAISAYRRALATAGPPEQFENPWITLDQFRQRIVAAFTHYLEAEKFDLALELLQDFRPIFPRSRQAELLAQTHRAWAEALQAKAAQARELEARQIRQRAAQQFRLAGEKFARLAEARKPTRHYPDDIWNSAENWLAGYDYAAAEKMYDDYLQIEYRQKRAGALLGLGRARLGLGKLDDAIDAFMECIDLHPREAAVYEARIGCSKAWQEKGDLPRAEKLLIDNLEGSKLTPASREWRESLFELGRVLYAMGRYPEAIGRLEEAVSRYPESPEAIEGLYLAAQAYRDSAREPQERMRAATVASVQIAERKEAQKFLSGALEAYEGVVVQLAERDAAGSLTTDEAAMLRNCHLAIGATLADMGRYEDAIKAYSNASSRYQNEPLVLEAFVQIFDCYRRLQKVVEARGAVAQAKVILKRLPADAAYKQTTNYDREEWGKLLDLLSAW